MFKFVTIYRRVEDEATLEKFFSQVHLPLLERLPGLVKTEISRVTGKPGGTSRFFLMVEAYFDSADSFFYALQTPSGQRLMPALTQWQEARVITWFYSDAFEEAVADRVSGVVSAESPPEP